LLCIDFTKLRLVPPFGSMLQPAAPTLSARQPRAFRFLDRGSPSARV